MNFQSGVHEWMLRCFGIEIASDKTERSHRFLEESLELVQAAGISKDEALKLVDYVFGRPVGELHQEVGGTLVTLAALCQAQGLSMEIAGEVELQRCWTKVEEIRAKQAAKPKMSPLPVDLEDPDPLGPSMDIRAKPGHKIVFKYPHAGYDHGKHGRDHLVVGNTYTVLDTVIGGGYTSVYLEEFKDSHVGPFNSVYFADEA